MTSYIQKSFDNPQYYRDLFLNHPMILEPQIPIIGKSFICVSFTRFCPVKCSFCFFSSSPAHKKRTIADALTNTGLDKFIDFANDSNLGYLLVSGGGEPFLEKKHLMKVVEHVKSDKIVLVTSGNWAKSKKGAMNIVDQLYAAFSMRKSPTNLILRLSVDEEHSRGGLGIDPALNLINIFREKFPNLDRFKLQFHSLINDPTVDKVLDIYRDQIDSIKDFTLKSDAETVLKVNPAEKLISFVDGYSLKVNYAKIFHSNLKVDMHDQKIIDENYNIFEWDMQESETGNPSVVTNMDGSIGYDFWVNFNGNVTTWGNQLPDNIYNIYEDSHKQVVKNSIADPISLAYIEKGDVYRSKLVCEVSPKTLLKAKATNIRDYTGAIICEEARMRLYLTIRVLQDYLSEGRISSDDLLLIPKELSQLILAPKDALIEAFKNSSYKILAQYINNKRLKSEDWLEFLELIKLGHYELTEDEEKIALDSYNEMSIGTPIKHINEVHNNPVGFFHEERIISIKENILNSIDALNACEA